MSAERSDPPSDFIGVPDEIDGDETSKEISALTNNIALLETLLDSERKERLEERFFGSCVCSILFDVIAVSAMDGSRSFLLIFMLQLIVLIGYAKKCGVDWAVQLLGALLHKALPWKNKD